MMTVLPNLEHCELFRNVSDQRGAGLYDGVEAPVWLAALPPCVSIPIWGGIL